MNNQQKVLSSEDIKRMKFNERMSDPFCFSQYLKLDSDFGVKIVLAKLKNGFWPTESEEASIIYKGEVWREVQDFISTSNKNNVTSVDPLENYTGHTRANKYLNMMRARRTNSLKNRPSPRQTQFQHRVRTLPNSDFDSDSDMWSD